MSILLVLTALCAADLSNYRGFRFGSDIATVAKQAGVRPADIRSVQRRPSAIQEIDWYLQQTVVTDPSRRGLSDPVTGGVMSFFEGKLYRMAVSYDRYKVEGMTSEDLIAAISQKYGAATRPDAEVRFHSYYGKVAKVLARWEDATYAYDLVRSGDAFDFAFVLYSKTVDRLAQASVLESARLDVLDAPRRAQEEEKKRIEDVRLALEKMRLVNKPNFRP